MPRKKAPEGTEPTDQTNDKLFRLTLADVDGSEPTIEVCTSYVVTTAGALILFARRRDGARTRKTRVLAPGTWRSLEETE